MSFPCLHPTCDQAPSLRIVAGMTMAAEDQNGETQEMLATRAETWQGFLRGSTWSIVGVAVVLILMAIFLL